jgi:ribonuclease HI
MATDGSVWEDGAMARGSGPSGKGMPWKSSSFEERRRKCPPSSSSFRAELTGILLALEEPEESVDAATLTDSLLSIQWMIAAQRLDWPIWLRSIMASQHSLLSIQWMIAAQRLDWSLSGYGFAAIRQHCRAKASSCCHGQAEPAVSAVSAHKNSQGESLFRAATQQSSRRLSYGSSGAAPERNLK